MTADLVQVRFEAGGSGEAGAASVAVEPGITILAASEIAGVEIVTGCTSGMCGTDPVRVLEGLDRLSVAEDHERGTLERMGLEDDFRLSCSARILAGPVHIQTDAF